ncbi:hypothetical protein MHPYR_180036 [uncultured Mycobacterium sp.]|uniref:DUF2510 domain-containing protein n=1 Tax=uncultured Mycobacterium sp. TaxID=171292 RepID=A0A1Y5P4W6_9MYCO|nr:hypothetical protein MHPYR_180036 [uncultured Mycobacterium sp.]
MSHLPPPSAVPGWYPDPAGGNGQRYWDGHSWGPVAPGTPAPMPAPARPSKPMSNAGKAILIIGSVVLAASCVAYLATGPHSSAPDMDKDGTYYKIDASTAGTYVTDGSQRSNGRPCNWTRTRTPTIEIINMIAMGDVAVGERGVVTVNAGEYFVTYGCKPWRKQ